MNVQVETNFVKMKATAVNFNVIGNGNLCSDGDYKNAVRSTWCPYIEFFLEAKSAHCVEPAADCYGCLYYKNALAFLMVSIDAACYLQLLPMLLSCPKIHMGIMLCNTYLTLRVQG